MTDALTLVAIYAGLYVLGFSHGATIVLRAWERSMPSRSATTALKHRQDRAD